MKDEKFATKKSTGNPRRQKKSLAVLKAGVRRSSSPLILSIFKNRSKKEREEKSVSGVQPVLATGILMHLALINLTRR